MPFLLLCGAFESLIRPCSQRNRFCMHNQKSCSPHVEKNFQFSNNISLNACSVAFSESLSHPHSSASKDFLISVKNSHANIAAVDLI